MLNPSQFLLDTEHVFVEVGSCETKMIYLPVHGNSDEDESTTKVDTGIFVEKNSDSALEVSALERLRSFFKELLFNLKFDTNESNEYIGKLINYLNTTTNISIAGFSAFIDELTVKPVAKAASMTAPVTPVQVFSSQQAVSQRAPGQNESTLHQSMQTNLPQSIVQGQVASVVCGATGAAGTAGVASSVPTAGAASSVGIGGAASFVGSARAGSDINFAGHASTTTASDVTQVKNDDKEMSLMHLMMHYSKENKAIYDAQKNQRKSMQTAAPAVQTKSTKTKREKKSKGAQGLAAQTEFAIPGMPQQNALQNTLPPQGMSYSGQQSVPVSQGTGYSGQQSVPVSYNTNVSQQQGAQSPSAQQFSAAPQVAPPAQQHGVALQTAKPYSAPVAFAPVTNTVNFGETTVLSPDRETTLLSDEYNPSMAPQPYLIRTKTNEKIILSGETFRIGKEEGYVNYCVKDNPTISRSHAVIRKDDNGYTIVDTNSTNHTYVDGKMTTGSAGAQLTHGVRIRLSDEEFVFYKS